MNRVEQILKNCKEKLKDWKRFNSSISELYSNESAYLKAQEQTALEFTKWKDENYILHGDDTGYVNYMEYFNGNITKYKTSEQLFNEWNNLNNK